MAVNSLPRCSIASILICGKKSCRRRNVSLFCLAMMVMLLLVTLRTECNQTIQVLFFSAYDGLAVDVIGLVMDFQ